ncbi:suppressor of fused domain protein [Kibdelosporangium persicum]
MVYRFAPAREQSREIAALVYKASPSPEYVTGVTFGLSVTAGRELVITMRSDDLGWGKVPARLAASLQGMYPFGKGQAVGYAGSLVNGSKLSSVVFAEPPIPELGDGIDIASEVRESDVIEFVGVYPVYASERDRVYTSGFDALWSLEWDRFDPVRCGDMTMVGALRQCVTPRRVL